MNAIRQFIADEPVIVRFVIGLIVSAAAGYGLDLDPEALFLAVAAIFGVSAVSARSKVTPD